MAFGFGFSFHSGQALQNATGVHRLLGLALLAQHGKLLFQVHQLPDTFIHMGYVLIKDSVDGASALRGFVNQVQ